MKMMIASVLLVSMAVVAGLALAADKPAAKKTLYHVVSFKFKKDAPAERIKAVEEAFVALKEKIPTITSINWGTNVSPEKHDKGFTHCFVLTFATEKDRDDYLPHPEHKKFGQSLGGIIDDVFVIDFWSSEK